MKVHEWLFPANQCLIDAAGFHVAMSLNTRLDSEGWIVEFTTDRAEKINAVHFRSITFLGARDDANLDPEDEKSYSVKAKGKTVDQLLSLLSELKGQEFDPWVSVIATPELVTQLTESAKVL